LSAIHSAPVEGTRFDGANFGVFRT
jgi:hypothetical protein